MRSFGCLASFLVTISTGLAISSGDVLARGGGAAGRFATHGGHAHFAFHAGTASVREGSRGMVHVVSKHVHTSGTTMLPFGTWDGGWADSFPEAVVATPAEAATESVIKPPVPEVAPPCRETQSGVTIVRGRSCRT